MSEYCQGVWRRLLRVPWTVSILEEVSPEYSLEGLMLKLKCQHFGHLMQRTDLLEKTLMLGKSEGRRRRGWQRMRGVDGITNSMDMSLSILWVLVMDREVWCGVLQSMGSQRVGHDWVTEQQLPRNSALLSCPQPFLWEHGRDLAWQLPGKCNFPVSRCHKALNQGTKTFL